MGMADQAIDRGAQNLESGPKTLGKPAPIAQNTAADAGRQVTDGRTGHVDQPSAGLLFKEGVTTAFDSLASLESDTYVIADAFRAPNLAWANDELASLLDTLRHLTTLTAALGDAAGVNLDSLDCGPSSAIAQLGHVADVVEHLVTAQHEQDWTLTADRLEFELVPAFEGWRSVIGAIENGSRA
jgi:hypothetical protein